MNTRRLLADAFDRVRQSVHRAVDGAAAETLVFRVDPGANTAAWLVWHLTRIQDDHVAAVAGRPQVWMQGGWHERFGLPFDPGDTGFGHSAEQVGAVRVDAELLTAYYDAVHERTRQFIETLDDDDLDRVVDERWDPPVTLGVRLVSVISDDLQHCGQASFVRGVAERR